MEQNAVTTVGLPVALGIIMLGLGLSLTVDDFKRVVKYPKAVAIGLVCQMLILPVACFALTKVFALTPALAVGLMLLSASPGGATANLFSHLAKGDVALNITLTAINSVLSMVTLPLIVNFSLEHFMASDQTLPLQFTKVISVIAVVLIPVGIGMLIRAKQPAFANKLDKPVRLISAVFLLILIIASLVRERANVETYFREVGLAALSFNLVSMGIGYFVPRIFRIEARQATAIGLEIGIHNGTLAIAIATSPQLLNNGTMAFPAAVYSIIMFFTAGAFGWFVARRTPAAS
jgi:BASS family bile acid:Na+ symporter